MKETFFPVIRALHVMHVMESGILATARNGINPRWRAVITFHVTEVDDDGYTQAARFKALDELQLNYMNGLLGRTPLTFHRNGKIYGACPTALTHTIKYSNIQSSFFGTELIEHHAERVARQADPPSEHRGPSQLVRTPSSD